MATSGTYAYNLQLDDIIEEAFDSIGQEVRTGYHLRTAKRSFNLLMLEWINEGINLWTVDNLTLPLVSGTSSYTIDPRYYDIYDAVVRDTTSGAAIDTPLTRYTVADYLRQPNKTTSGRPTSWTIERNSAVGHTVYVWPTPNSADYALQCLGLRYVQDADDYSENVDIPKRFLPAATAGLAFRLAEKYAPERVQEKLLIYNNLFEKARYEDRERASFMVSVAGRRR